MTVERVLRELCGRIWHTTTEERFDRILRSGEISPEPEIPDAERWSTGSGPKHYPYARSLGGVSLFDFRRFDAEEYSRRYPMSQWRAFVPCQRSRNSAVWIEIDHEQLGGQFISGSELIARWEAEEAHGHRIMPHIEAAHLGPVPRRAFKRAFLVRSNDDDQFHELLTG
jgi:hypothetical protein